MTSRSLWMDIDVAPQTTCLFADESCDVVVIGAGVAGISTAYELALLLDKRDASLRIPYVFTGSEPLYPHQRELILARLVENGERYVETGTRLGVQGT